MELAQRAVDALSIQVDALEQGAAIPRMSPLVAALAGQDELLALTCAASSSRRCR
ncbi:hypothetical protein [Chromatium okenii]|uniref:hypothetical protein n=1 Tax=Chromatium okenii TaxID=61644 RepID=UPI001F5B8CF0|nr:hypothetical protein [Chromatium okenii]